MWLVNLICGPISVNTYLVGEDGGTDCAVIDPGVAGPVLEYLQEHGLTCTHILITHGHYDHIGGVGELRKATGALVCIHEADAPALRSSQKSLALMLGSHMEPVDADVLLHDGDTLDAAGLHFTVLHTPGHSPGGVCYILEKERVIFCGDTVFAESYGRTDFPGCSFEELQDSILNKLFLLEGDYQMYPGHDESTTLTHERQCNPMRNDKY